MISGLPTASLSRFVFVISSNFNMKTDIHNKDFAHIYTLLDRETEGGHRNQAQKLRNGIFTLMIF